MKLWRIVEDKNHNTQYNKTIKTDIITLQMNK